MIYTKTTENGIQKETPLTSLQMFCKCPKCGKEVRLTPSTIEDIAADAGENFSFDDIGMYCDECNEVREARADVMKFIHQRLDKLSLFELEMNVAAYVNTLVLNEQA